jgi:aminoglycoside phosphotransferase (APT) family kinase protein
VADKTTIQLINLAINSLRKDVAPEITDDHIRIKFDHLCRLLYHAQARLDKRQDGLTQYIQQAQSSGLGPVNSCLSEDPAGLERTRHQIEKNFLDSLPSLIDNIGTDATALDKLDAMLQLEKTFYLSQDPDIAGGSQVVYRGGRIESERPILPPRMIKVLDGDTLTDYLRQRFGRDSVSATEIRVVPGGFSKGTIFFTLNDLQAGSAEKLVIRKDMPVPFIEKTVVNEFGLLKALFEKGFPVAEPLWLEEDYGIFNGRFMVSRRVAGNSNVVEWAADNGRANRACENLARILATLHGYEPQALGRNPELSSLSAGELMSRDIEAWHDLFERKKQEPLPLQDFPLQWLMRNVPKVLFDRPARIVHGDFGFHNLMIGDSGDITAILDWEFSVLGDPTQDLCFLRPFIESIYEWDDFIKLYVSHGGSQPCDEAEFFFTLWSKVRNAVGCVDSQAIFDNDMPDEIKFALSGHVFGPYLYIDESESLIKHLRGLVTAEK